MFCVRITSYNVCYTKLLRVVLKNVLSTASEYCEGETGVSVYLEGTPQDNITYELWRSSDNTKVGSSIMYNSLSPVPVQWDNIKGDDQYRIEAYYSSVPAQRYA